MSNKSYPDPDAIDLNTNKELIKILTWNLWWKFENFKDREKLIFQELRSLIPDIMCLQEVWVEEDESQAKKIADEFGYFYTYKESFEFDGVKFGNAIISKYKIVNYSSKFFTEVPGKDEKKLFIHAEIDYKDTILNIICTHLNYKYEHQQVRQNQVTELMDYISKLKNSEFPFILCGDFNADPISDEIRTITGHKQPVSDVVLRDAWMITNPDDIGFTWSNDNHWAARTLEYNRRIDYIFIGKPGSNGIGQPIKSELVGTNCYENIFPSDHFGVMTHLVGK